MNRLLGQLRLNVLLHYRSALAALYSFLFPTIFLLAFWVLYQYETPPIARHLGELLTVTALGGACFGLPTAMVADRERGVWRRYRLAPVAAWELVTATVLGRYLLLLTAGLLQVVLAMAIGMPLPNRPFDLFVVFTVVCFAFMGLGLMIAVMADNVPAVQALGQCIFLPMLIIGGIAVRLERLPEWAQHLSAFFPGRYSVEAIQATVTGEGMTTVGFALLALAMIGIAGTLAGARMFRWDAQQRFAAHEGKGWIVVALSTWLAVGVLAEATGRIAIGGVGARTAGDGGTANLAAIVDTAGSRSEDTPALVASTDSVSAATDSLAPPGSDSTRLSPTADTVATTVASPAAAAASTPEPLTGWRAVTAQDIERDIRFDQVPIDEDVVTPVATVDDALPEEFILTLNCMRGNFQTWPSAHVADPVQRVRNILYVAAIPDYIQMDMERWIPLIVFERLQQQFTREDLTKILYWIATHPNEGDESAANQLRGVCLDTFAPDDLAEPRLRAAVYAVKLLGRITGKINPR